MAISEQLDPATPRVMKSHQRFLVLAVLFSLSMLTIVDRVAVSYCRRADGHAFRRYEYVWQHRIVCEFYCFSIVISVDWPLRHVLLLCRCDQSLCSVLVDDLG